MIVNKGKTLSENGGNTRDVVLQVSEKVIIYLKQMFLGNPPIKSPLSSIFFAQRSSEKDTRQRGFYRGITY